MVPTPTKHSSVRPSRTVATVYFSVSWAFYGVLLAGCLINWDVFITRYNIETPVKTGIIDVRFLLEDVSAKNLPLLYEHQELLKTHFSKITDKSFARMGSFDNMFNAKKNSFLQEHNTYSWLSWNYADAKVLQFLKEKNVNINN